MSLKRRLEKLEASIAPLNNIDGIAYFIVEPGGIEIGYRSDEGTEIMRKLDESEADFKARCCETVNWPIGENPRHIIFEPIYAELEAKL
jgi:hypothetical protein